MAGPYRTEMRIIDGTRLVVSSNEPLTDAEIAYLSGQTRDEIQAGMVDSLRAWADQIDEALT